MLESPDSPPEIHPHRLWLWGGLVFVIIILGVWYVAQIYVIDEDNNTIEANQPQRIKFAPKTSTSTAVTTTDVVNTPKAIR